MKDEVMNPKGRGLKFEIVCIEWCIEERKKLGKDTTFEEDQLKRHKRLWKKRRMASVTSGKLNSSGIKH